MRLATHTRRAALRTASGLFLLLLALVGTSATPMAQTTLAPGDLVVIGSIADNPDAFSLLAMVDIETGTEFKITDKGVSAAGVIQPARESIRTFTTTAPIAAGEVLVASADADPFYPAALGIPTGGTSFISLSESGDQLLIFQGETDSPQFIFLFSSNPFDQAFDPTNGGDPDNVNQSATALPPGLTNGTSAIDFDPHFDDIDYDRANGTSGTRDAVLALVSNDANYTTSNDRFNLQGGSFAIETGGAPIMLPVTFEESINYELTDFGGAEQSMVVVDPTDATNMVVRTFRPATAECFAGTTVAEVSGFDQAIPFTMDATTMSVRVWSPEAGIRVLFKVEEVGNPGLNVETFTFTTVAGGWETMVFDFANPMPNMNPIQFGANYNKASIFFDFQCGLDGAPPADRTYYWDDVAFGSGSTGGTDSALILTGVVDGPLSGGVPKGVELYVTQDIADLSLYGLGSANNADGTNGVEFAFPMGSASAGDFIYVASEDMGFTTFFGFAPDYTSGAVNINGDDSIELFYDPNGVVEAAPGDVPATTVVVDVFGEVGVDGTGQPWEHLDGWAYRVDATGPDGSTFDLASWTFSGVDALDGETTNATAATPFPVGTYSPMMGGGDPVARLQVIHNSPDPAAAVVDIYVNDALFLDDVPFRGASPFQNVPAGVDLKVDIVGGSATDNSSPVFTETYNLPEDVTAQLIATGVVEGGFSDNPDGISTDFTLLASVNAQEAAADPGKVDVRVVHGSPDAPTVDVRTGGTVLFDDAPFKGVTDYLAVDPAVYTLDITDATGATTVASVVADLSGAAGGAVTVLASGFLTPADDKNGPAFGLLAVFPDGTSALLPAFAEEFFAGYLLGANEVPAVETDAAGFVEVTLAGNQATITGSFAGLSSDYLFSHFHRAPAGGNGPVIATLSPMIGDDSRSGTFSETVTLSEADVNALRAGEIYVNVHSETNSGGELRAQLVMNPATPVVTMAQARNIGVGTTVTLLGTVSRAAGAFTYVQDATGAITIRQTSGDFFDAVADGTIAPGRFMRVTGELSEFASLLQINGGDLSIFSIGGETATPTAQVVTLAELAANGEAYEAELVTVETVTIGEGDNNGGIFAPATTYPIADDSDATGAVSLRIPNAADGTADGTDVPPRATITAVVGQFNFDDPTAGYQLLVTDADDIEALPAVASEIGPDGTVVSLTVANPIRGMATVRFSAGTSTTASVSLYDMLGRRVATLADGPVSGAQTVSLDAGSLSAGVYVLRLQTEDLALTETVTVVR